MDNKNRRWILKGMAGSCIAQPALTAWADTEAVPKQHPIEAFARRPLMERIALSPNGERLAAIINNGSTSTLITRAFTGGPVQSVLSTENLEFNFKWIRWVNNDRLVLSLRFPSQRMINVVQSIPTMETRLMAVNADGSNLINLVKAKIGSNALRWAANQDRVIDWLPEDGKHILMHLPNSERSYTRVIFKINVDTGERVFYSGGRPEAVGWITDRQHRARVAMCMDELGEYSIWVCNTDGSNWRVLRQYAPGANHDLSVLGFGLDPEQLYVLATHKGLSAVHTLDLRDPKYPLTLKLGDEGYDLDGSLIYDARGEAVGINTTREGDSSIYFWDAKYKEWQKALDEALPNRFNQIGSVSGNGLRYVLRSSKTGLPATWYLGEEGDNPSIKQLAQMYPELNPSKLAVKQPISYKARDGLLIKGYLTPPLGAQKGKPLPLVLFPHGGPISDDGPEFDEWVSFMADRGYAVLQVNFRGSTGQGRAFMEAGLRRWGLEMQDDLTDAVAEFVKRGIADPDRVAIVGASYGGYAALMGAIKTPKLFKGAFAFAPVTDLLELTEEEGQDSSKETMRRQLGHYRDDAERLRATSPRFHADKIQVPIYLIHGTHDRQAMFRHSVWMAEALKAAGKPHEFVTLENGDHQLSHYPYRLRLFGDLEKFLAKTIGPGRSTS
ncbi:S9 family peptidase [Paucibacter sp. B51]|uniref:S9 family peptidase n=1 Tax=Paucibacter sp. B51 TaxID=2993315 RepID=UPI0022EBBB94|nr:S9 family peptidase [Paucibacter sp. B51]